MTTSHNTFCLYVDDSGTRHPDHPSAQSIHGHDWFGLGGALIHEAELHAAKQAHAAFLARWQIDAPLHSYKIRQKKEPFRDILHGARRQEFLADLTTFLCTSSALGFACVIDRRGYNLRYSSSYGDQKWSLCKTAFSVLVERAAKYVEERDGRLRVFVERSDKETDRQLEGYYDALRSEGPPFATVSSAKYLPMTAGQFRSILLEFRTKTKSSALMQIADLYLWPMCIGGYDKNNQAYRALFEAKRLVDCELSEHETPMLGIKYSCFEHVGEKK